MMEDIDKKDVKNREESDKCLYTYEYVVNSSEYKKMARYFPQMYWHYVVCGGFYNLIISAIIAIVSRSFFGTLGFLLCFQIYLMIIYKVRLEYFVEQTFNAMQKQGSFDNNIHTEFYKDYFIRQGDTITYKIRYDEIDRCVETDTNFYLKNKKKNLIIFIQKNKCDSDLISFIREKIGNIDVVNNKKSKQKKKLKVNNSVFVKNGMTALFALTVVSIWLAIFSLQLVNELIPHHFINQNKNMWIFWCWLPIPILSIILGFKFNKAEIKCNKNIVAGFIVGFLLIVFGSFCLIPTFSVDYKEIDAYRSVIDAKLPKSGELTIENWDTCSGTDRSKCSIINSYYNNEDVSDLVDSIENSDNWFLSTEIKSSLKLFIPLGLYSDEDAYFSIYNKTTDQYNTLPDKSGDYEIYVMKYDKSERHLEIYKYMYSYKN